MKDFVAIGVGQLHYPEEFVKQGEPLPVLKGGMRFLAERMGVECPPLVPSTRKEFEMLNEMFKEVEKMTTRAIVDICKKICEIYDGIKIFPKLPMQVKAYHKKWLKNQLIKQAHERMKERYNRLLQNFAKPRSEAGRIGLQISQESNTEHENVLSVVQRTNFVIEIQQFVPPLAAMEQAAFIRPFPSAEEPASQQARRCYYFPFCRLQAQFCGGFMSRQCSYLNVAYTAPSAEELAQKKREKRLEEKREREREQRARKRQRDCS